jgi:hypothetical protein
MAHNSFTESNALYYTQERLKIDAQALEITTATEQTSNNNNNNNNTSNNELVFCSRSWKIIRRWLVESVWPGMGLFGESYMLFSIGTLTPLWQELYPDCFNNQVCKPQLLHSLTYSVVLGVIVGMITVGYAANTIGRRKGSLLTAGLMSGGAIAMVIEAMVWTSQESVVTLYRCMAVSLFVFG